MRATKIQWAGSVLFCAFLLGMALLLFLLPARSYSPREKRYLAPVPETDAAALLSGRTSAQTEDYVAEHLPGRDAWVGLAAYYDWLSGRQNTKEILRGRSGRLYERPVRWDEARVKENLEAVEAFAEAVGRPVDLLLVPSAGYVLQEDLPGLHDRYRDGEMIRQIYAAAGGQLRPLDVLPLLKGAEDPAALYYETDHHWTSRGAYTAAKAYLEARGRSLPEAEAYTVRREPGFFGSTYARSALWLRESESVELWDSGTPFTVTLSEAEGTHEGLFFPERLTGDDAYTVFLDGNHALVRIENGDADSSGSLLVIRDSFANCLGGFLAEGYRSVVLADLRYYKYPLSELCAAEDFDDVLVVYSLSHFLTDGNLLWLD